MRDDVVARSTQPTLTMRERVAAHDWSATPLGPRDAWPPFLNITLEVMLATEFPAFLAWGPSRVVIYNDAYLPILADKHPLALGRTFFEVWPEVRELIEPVIDRAFLGEGSFFRDLPVELERYGRLQPAYFTFSYSPVREGQGAQVHGVLCICNETTEAVLNERHDAFLLGLDARLRLLNDPRAIIVATQEALGRHLGANRVGYGEADTDQRHFHTDDNWTDGKVDHEAGSHDLAAFGEDVLQAMRRGETLVISDAAQHVRRVTDGDLPAFEQLDIAAAVAVSLVKDGRLTAALYVHQRAPRAWTAAEVRLIEAAGERIWSAVARARAEAALRKNEARFREFFEAAGDAIFVEDEHGRYVEVNAAACRLLGYERDELIGMAVRDVVAPHDTPRISRWRRTEGRGHPSMASWRLRRKDGGWVEVEISAQMLPSGGVEAVVRDVSQRKAEEARRSLMMHELNHRVKNSLAAVQAIAAQTLRTGGVAPAVRQAFTDRLMALARANDILVAKEWRGASLADIAAEVASPYAGPEGRFVIRGPEVALPPKAATAMALALHELATNAAKYGALSAMDGRILLEWRLAGGQLVLTWQEEGGPQVQVPSHVGFGTRLIREGLKAELTADVHIDYRPSGLVCTVRAAAPSAHAAFLDLQAHDHA